MLEDDKTPMVSKEGETKSADPAKLPFQIVDKTDQLPEGLGAIMFLAGGEWPEDEEEIEKGK